MPSKKNTRPAPRGGLRSAVLAAILVAGCTSGSTGGCGNSCGGAFKTTGPTGQPIVFTGTKLDNVAQVRFTSAAFNFLNAANLNDILTKLNGNAPAINIPCTTRNVGLNACPITEFNSVLIGDSNFDGACTAADQTLAHINFKDVSWGFDPTRQILRAKLLAHIFTDPIYIRTTEAHSSLCGTTAPIQARVFYQDELNIPGTQNDTEIDLDIKFTPSPDGRMEINVTDASLLAIVDRFDASHIGIDGFASPGIPASGTYSHNACGSSSGTYNPSDGQGNLTCGGVLRVINAECNQSDPNPQGLCLLFQTIRDYLLNTLKNQFAPQIVNLLRGQIDKVRCQRVQGLDGGSSDCSVSNRCGQDDNGQPLTCDTGRGVCVPGGQSPLDPGSGQTGTVSLPDGGVATVGEHNCEPIPFGVTGQLDVTSLTDKVGFPPSDGLLVTLGLGSKTVDPTRRGPVDSNGIQLSAMAGTGLPPGAPVSVCVPPAFWTDEGQPAELNFDDPANKPANVAGYDVGVGIASQMINRGLYDAYSASVLCVTLNNHTSSFISSGLFQTFLPSLGLITGGRDVPMAVVLRPSQPPFVRVGLGTNKTGPDGVTIVPDDPLITVHFQKMKLDFYALVDERQARVFTLQADLDLPLGLRTVAGGQGDTLQPVLGSLDTLLTNISASNNEMLAEDPSVVRDLIGAAVRLAQPLLAGVLKPVQLPAILGLRPQVGAVVGAVPVSNNLADGYQHVVVYTQLATCTPQNPCQQYNVKAQARIASRTLPNDLEEARGPNRVQPAVEIEGSALGARRGGTEEYSFRVDGGLWSPWVRGPRFTVRDPIFAFPGHHRIEVTARESGDDRTQDPDPVELDFFVSFAPPKVELLQRTDGSVFTRAHSIASADDKLLYSYRLGGSNNWTEPGAARVFTAAELGGRGLWVSVSDEGGRAAMAHFGADEAESALAAGTVGCSTSSRTTGAGLVLLALAFGLLAARKRR